MKIFLIAVLASISSLFSGVDVPEAVSTPTPEAQVASWYDYDIASDGYGYVCHREIDDCYTESHFVAASRDYPRGTMVEVCRGDRCVIVKITDYIEHPERDIDLSSFAFSHLAPLSYGLIGVNIRAINE